MSENKLHIDPNQIHLNYIEEVSVTIDNTEPIKDSKVTLSTNIAHISAHNLDKNQFLFGLHLVFNTNNLDVIHECNFRYNFHFIIDNLKEMYEIDKDKEPVFKEIFAATLAGISYSTLRGIVFEKTKDSNWGTIILPVVNPAILLESWIGKD